MLSLGFASDSQLVSVFGLRELEISAPPSALMGLLLAFRVWLSLSHARACGVEHATAGGKSALMGHFRRLPPLQNSSSSHGMVKGWFVQWPATLEDVNPRAPRMPLPPEGHCPRLQFLGHLTPWLL